MSENEKTPEHTHGAVDVRRLSAPLFTLVSLASFIVWSTVTVISEKHNVYDELYKVKQSVSKLTDELNSVKDKQRYVLRNIWTRSDYAIVCSELEKKNFESNFKCPDYEAMRSLGLLGIDDGPGNDFQGGYLQRMFQGGMILPRLPGQSSSQSQPMLEK